MSKRIPQAFIHDLITRTDLVELIEARIKINKKGQNYLGLCPFHNEKSPSFTVSPQKQFYYCFGCGANGNALGFLMQYDHMDFIDAVSHLSAQLGLTMPDSEGERDTNHDHFEILQKASDYFQQQLRKSQAAIDYLKSRGLTGKIAKTFKLGYAEDKWDGLIKHFKGENSAVQKLIEAGLVIHKDGNKTYDRFRNRIIFPIHDTRGRVIAFGGRALNNDPPKYLNSPETAIFHKNRELYGLYETLQHAHHPKTILVTEGYMDVIALHQYGLHNAVATLGTATNPKHLQKLFRYTNEVIFCFDGDQAGQNAAWKALTVNLPFMRDGIQLRFMFLTQGNDPDSLIRRIGLSGFEQRLKQAKPLSQVFFELIKQEAPLNSPDGKAHYAKLAADYLNQMPKGLFRELMFDELAKSLQVYVSDLASLQKTQPTSHKKVHHNKNTPLKPAKKAIALLLQQPKLCLECDSKSLSSLRALPGVSLLVFLLETLQKQPDLSIGELISLCDEENEQREIAALASLSYPFPREGLLAEFHGAIERLKESHQEQVTNALIEKAKNGLITPEEKEILSQLLTQRHKDFI